MSLPRAFDLYVDAARPGGAQCLLNGTRGAPAAETPQWMQSDIFTLRLHFRALAGLNAETTAVAVTSGDVIVLAGKVNAAANDLVFSALSWTEVVSGDDTYYQALLHLDTPELETALGESASKEIFCDLEVQNGDNTARQTYRFSVTINAQLYNGGESDPTPGTPEYPAPTAVMVKDPPGGSYRFKDGNLQFWNPTTEKFHTMFPSGAEGSVVTAWGEGED